MKVIFLHPDLGIGGAERLVVDAAMALQNKGHAVKMITNHYDSSHCFKETEHLDITVYSYFPRTIFGHMWALCAYIRMIIAAFIIAATMDYDVIFSDQVSASQVVFRLIFWKPVRLIFYCHHPDLLLTDRKTAAKSAYRLILDFVEEQTTRLADVICVNSLYTAEVTKKTFGSLRDRELTVLYPSLNTEFFDKAMESTLTEIPGTAEHVFSSLNRFEVKKNVILALEAFAELKSLLPADDYTKCHLVIAGGYDKRNEENIAYYSQLVKYAQDLELDASQITFMRSPSDQNKISLLKQSRAILYTPDREHFGIVPVEAMYLGRPVIAVNTGETIEHEKTGFLVEQKPQEFAKCMARLVADPHLRQVAEIEGPKRVRKLFAFPAFATRLHQIVNNEL